MSDKIEILNVSITPEGYIKVYSSRYGMYIDAYLENVIRMVLRWTKYDDRLWFIKCKENEELKEILSNHINHQNPFQSYI